MGNIFRLFLYSNGSMKMIDKNVVSWFCIDFYNLLSLICNCSASAMAIPTKQINYIMVSVFLNIYYKLIYYQKSPQGGSIPL